MKTKYSNQQKAEIVREFKQSGMPAIRFGKKYGVFGTSILRWKKSRDKKDIEVSDITNTENIFVYIGGVLIRKTPIYAYYYHLSAKTHVECVVLIEQK